MCGAAAALAAAACVSLAQAQDNLEKVNRTDSRAWDASLVTLVKPGELVRWRSNRLVGEDIDLMAVVNGRHMEYGLKPRTGGCVGYAYGEGVAVRLSVCELGREVSYIRARAVNAGIKPARLKLRFAAR